MQERESASEAVAGNLVCDEVPVWRRNIARWQAPIAFAPFALVVLFAQTKASDAMPHWIVLPILLVPVLWAVAFSGYLLYLRYQT